MAEQESDGILWQVIGDSVIGASHVRSGLPNQDAIEWAPKVPARQVVVAVADGHGSKKSFRSDVGSRRAVESAMSVFGELVAALPEELNLSSVKDMAEQRFPRDLVRIWREAIDAELAKKDFSPEEFQALERHEGEKGLRAVRENKYLAFGSTLLSVFLHESFGVFVQLGDGDILTVASDGTVARPLPGDSRLIANESTSLCMEKAWEAVRVGFASFSGGPPAMVLLATDGYTNAFVDDANWRRVGSDIVRMIQVDGLEKVQSQLRGWLGEASQTASGDDVTLGLIVQAGIANRARRGIAEIAGDDLPEQEKVVTRSDEAEQTNPSGPGADVT